MVFSFEGPLKRCPFYPTIPPKKPQNVPTHPYILNKNPRFSKVETILCSFLFQIPIQNRAMQNRWMWFWINFKWPQNIPIRLNGVWSIIYTWFHAPLSPRSHFYVSIAIVCRFNISFLLLSFISYSHQIHQRCFPWVTSDL